MNRVMCWMVALALAPTGCTDETTDGPGEESWQLIQTFPERVGTSVAVATNGSGAALVAYETGSDDGVHALTFDANGEFVDDTLLTAENVADFTLAAAITEGGARYVVYREGGLVVQRNTGTGWSAVPLTGDTSLGTLAPIGAATWGESFVAFGGTRDDDTRDRQFVVAPKGTGLEVTRVRDGEGDFDSAGVVVDDNGIAHALAKDGNVVTWLRVDVASASPTVLDAERILTEYDALALFPSGEVRAVGGANGSDTLWEGVYSNGLWTEAKRSGPEPKLGDVFCYGLNDDGEHVMGAGGHAHRTNPSDPWIHTPRPTDWRTDNCAIAGAEWRVSVTSLYRFVH